MAWSLLHTTTWAGPVAAVGAGLTLQDNWVDLVGNKWSINASNQIVQAAGAWANGLEYQLNASGDSLIDVTFPAAGVTSNTACGPCLRRQSTGEYYLFFFNMGGGFVQVYRMPSATLVHNFAFTIATGDAHRLVAYVTGTTTVTVGVFLRDTTAGIDRIGTNGADVNAITYATATDVSPPAAYQGTGKFAFTANHTGDLEGSTISMYSTATASFTVAGPNSATALPANHNGNITLSLVGTGTAWTSSTTFTPSGVAGWSFVSKAFTDSTHYTVTLAPPAAATPPAGATGTLTLTEGVTGTTTSTITVGTPSFTVSPSTAIPSAGATTLTFGGTNTLWQSDNPQFTMSPLSGSSLGSSTATTNTASTGTMTVGATTGTTTITDPSTGATQTFQVSNATPGSVTDLNMFFSPYTWYSPGGGAMQSNNVNGGSTYVITNCMGAYVKFKANCTGVTLNYDATLYSGAGDYPIIMYSVDDGAFTTYQLASGDSGARALAAGLSAGVHTFAVYVKCTGSTLSNDRWNWSAAPYIALKITSFTITGGTGATSAVALRTKRAIFFGDSITEGLHAAQGDTNVHDATSTYVAYVAAALNAEYGQVGFNGQRWNGGSNNVPSFHTSGGSATTQSWQSYASGKLRLVSGAFSPAPDYVAVMMGTNDGISSTADATVTADANDWLTAMLTAAPGAKVFLVLPPGRFKKTALAAATLNSGQFYLDLDASSPADQLLAQGLGNVPAGDSTAAAAASWRATDGLHPNSRTHAEIGARLTQAAMNKIQPAGGSGGGRRRFQ